jgi:hypothetical protein
MEFAGLVEKKDFITTIDRSVVQKKILILETQLSLWKDNIEKVEKLNRELRDWQSLLNLLDTKELGVESGLKFLGITLGIDPILTQIQQASDIENRLKQFINSDKGSSLNTLKNKPTLDIGNSLGLNPFSLISEKLSPARFTILKVLFSNYSLMSVALKNYSLLYKKTGFKTNIIDLKDIFTLLNNSHDPDQIQYVWQLYMLVNYIRIGVAYLSKSTENNNQGDRILADYSALFNHDFQNPDTDIRSKYQNSILKSINNKQDIIGIPYHQNNLHISPDAHPEILNLLDKIYTEIIEPDNDFDNTPPNVDPTNLIKTLTELSNHFNQQTSFKEGLKNLINKGTVLDPNQVIESQLRSNVTKGLELNKKIQVEVEKIITEISQNYILDESVIKSRLSNTEYSLVKKYDQTDLMNSFCLFLLDLPSVVLGYNLQNIQNIINTSLDHINQKSNYSILNQQLVEPCNYLDFKVKIDSGDVDSTWKFYQKYLNNSLYPKLSESEIIRFCEQIDYFIDQQINKLFNDEIDPIYRLNLHQRILKRIINYIVIPSAFVHQPIFSAGVLIGANTQNIESYLEKMRSIIEQTCKDLKNRPLENRSLPANSTLWEKMHTTSSDTKTLNTLPSTIKVVALASKPIFLLSSYYHLLPNGDRKKVYITSGSITNCQVFHIKEKPRTKKYYKMTVQVSPGINTFLVPENSRLGFGVYKDRSNSPVINYSENNQPPTISIESQNSDLIDIYFIKTEKENSVLVRYCESLDTSNLFRPTNWQQWGVIRGSKVEKQLINLETKVINGEITKLPQIISGIAKILKSLKIPYDFTEQDYSGDYAQNIAKRFILATQKVENHNKGAICQDFAAFGGIFLAEILKHIGAHVFQKSGYDSQRGVCINIPHMNLVAVSKDGKDIVEFDPTSLSIASKTSRNMDKMIHQSMLRLNHLSTTKTDIAIGLATVVLMFGAFGGVVLNLKHIYGMVDRYNVSSSTKNHTLPTNPKILPNEPPALYNKIYSLKLLKLRKPRAVLESISSDQSNHDKQKSGLENDLNLVVGKSKDISKYLIKQTEGSKEDYKPIGIWDDMPLAPELKSDLQNIHLDYVNQMNLLRKELKTKFPEPNPGETTNYQNQDSQLKTELSERVGKIRLKIAITLAKYFRIRAKIAPVGNIYTNDVLKDFQQDLNKTFTTGLTPKQISIIYAATYDLIANNHSKLSDSSYINRTTILNTFPMESNFTIPVANTILVSNISDFQVVIETNTLDKNGILQNKYNIVDPVPEFVSDKLKQDLIENYQRPSGVDSNAWIYFLSIVALAGGSVVIVNHKKIPNITKKVVENGLNLFAETKTKAKTMLSQLKSHTSETSIAGSMKKIQKFENLTKLMEQSPKALLLYYILAGNIYNFLRYSQDKMHLSTHLPDLINQSLKQTISHKNTGTVYTHPNTEPASLIFSDIAKLTTSQNMLYLNRWLFERTDLILPFEYNDGIKPHINQIIESLSEALDQNKASLDTENRTMLSKIKEHLESISDK